MYTMKEVCLKNNMTYETLKFYCNKGLVPRVKRDKNNHRVFDDHDVAWIESLTCLKNCGMSIQEMKDYLDLCLQGQQSIPKRQDMLNKKREELKEKIAILNKSVDYIDWKQEFYQDVLDGKIEYKSHLINVDSKDSNTL